MLRYFHRTIRRFSLKPRPVDPAPAPRENCYRCWRPKVACLCPSAPPLATATRLVLLMHPSEFKDIKCNTGRLLCLHLANSEIIVGTSFDGDKRLTELLEDPGNHAMLMFPGPSAVNISSVGSKEEEEQANNNNNNNNNNASPLLEASSLGKRLVVFLLDATWTRAKQMFRNSPVLQRLPQLCVAADRESRYVIKKQPSAHCLSTLEAAHELLLALDRLGLERYEGDSRLLETFAAMQAYQVHRALQATREGTGGEGKKTRLLHKFQNWEQRCQAHFDELHERQPNNNDSDNGNKNSTLNQ